MPGLLNPKKAARELQGMGIRGDTILAHINPREVSLLKAHGGAGTKNPRTGLLQFDSEGGGDGPGGEGGGNGPGMGADGGDSGNGNGNGGTQGGNSVSGGANGMGVGGGNASGGANSGANQGVSGGDGTPSGAPGVDQVGATQGLSASQAMGLTGRQTTLAGMLAGMLGVPGLGVGLSAANALSAHGVDQSNNPGGNLSSGQTGGVGLGKGSDTDPGLSGGGNGTGGDGYSYTPTMALASYAPSRRWPHSMFSWVPSSQWQQAMPQSAPPSSKGLGGL